MNKSLLGVLKKMVKNPNTRKKDIWMESEIQMDDHFNNATTVIDFYTGIHNLVSGFSKLSISKKYLSRQI